MDDVKQQTTDVQPQAEETAVQASQPDEQTTEAPETSVEETQSLSPKGDLNIALKQERERVRELRRQLAEKESSQALSQLDPNDYEAWVSNPMSQELIIKVAKQELTDYAREALDQYPTLHPQVKKAILKNARGFVNESTTDVETAKIDLQEYIESIAEEANAEPEAQSKQPSKGFQVANTNVPSSEAGRVASSKQVEAILAKPVNEWTDEDEATVAEHQKLNSK